jgi:hypothetical protein
MNRNDVEKNINETILKLYKYGYKPNSILISKMTVEDLFYPYTNCLKANVVMWNTCLCELRVIFSKEPMCYGDFLLGTDLVDTPLVNKKTKGGE